LTDAELKAALRDAAYLEGDFVCARASARVTTSTSTASRPARTSSRRWGDRIAAAVAEVEPDAARLAGPELGAVALAAAASLASGLPFVIVRKAAKEYGTSNRLEGVYEEGELVCLVEDVVTSGGALLEAVDALRAGRSGPCGLRSAWSIARRAAPTRSRAKASGCGRFSVRARFWRRENPAKPHG
jgi:orotate phosphoribosyltransferase